MTATPQSTVDVLPYTPLDELHPLGTTTPEDTPTIPFHSFSTHTPVSSSPMLSGQDKEYADQEAIPLPPPKKGTRYLRSALLIVVTLVAVAVVIPVYFLVIKRSTQVQPHTGKSQPPPSGSSNPATTWGGNGSTVTASDGSTFTYINPFGGYCKCCHGFPRRTFCRFSSLFSPHTINVFC